VTLAELLEEVDVEAVRGPLEVTVTDVVSDSRQVRPGAAFFALSGARADGGTFARAAVEAGAVAVVGAVGEVEGATAVAVADPRVALAQAAARFHGHPARDLIVAGVTGTNGKTTTTWLIDALAGVPAGVIGTTGARIAREVRPLGYTTPEAPELQRLLATMRDRGVRCVAMEISSHALAQRRAWGLELDAAVFTNLTQDHLDYHGTMDAYLDAKLMLFDGRNGGAGKRTRIAAINADDPAAPRVVAAAARGGWRTLTYGEVPAADVRIERVEIRPLGLEVRLRERGGRAADFALPLLGRYNAWNLAAAWTATRALGLAATLDPDPAAVRVPGRLEPVDAGQPFLVVVDYAHTPDALARALAAVREHARGRVLLVFGCGGDRDRAKRPLMGRAAAAAADRAWVTNDNPRSEDPAAIARAIVAGAPGADLTIELDRRAAIAAALASARPGDAVLIAGKGHEITQTIGDRVTPFDDRAVARELLGAGGRP